MALVKSQQNPGSGANFSFTGFLKASSISTIPYLWIRDFNGGAGKNSL